MKKSATTDVAIVVAVYMMPGPRTIRTVVQVIRRARHQVARAIAHVDIQDRDARAGRTISFRRSNSISRETPIRIHLVQNEKIPFTTITTTIVRQ